MADARPVLIVAGPTASGKSALAMAVAERFRGVVINADSMQVYRELRILTARPSPSDEVRVPHRLYGVMSAAEPCSAGRWRTMALAEIEAAHADGRLPVLCGGTGLYLKSLTEGLSPMPQVPAAVRAAVRGRLKNDGAAALHRELAARDPATAARLEPSDGQRIARALEILEATGRTLAAWQSEPPSGPPPGLDFSTILLVPPRDVLYAACGRRLEEMIAAGALEEVRQLVAMGLDPALPAMKALGIPELARHLAGNCELESAVRAAQQATRRYAKRQLTWLRHQIVADLVYHEQFSERLLGGICTFIRQNVLTVVE